MPARRRLIRIYRPRSTGYAEACGATRRWPGGPNCYRGQYWVATASTEVELLAAIVEASAETLLHSLGEAAAMWLGFLAVRAFFRGIRTAYRGQEEHGASEHQQESDDA